MHPARVVTLTVLIAFAGCGPREPTAGAASAGSATTITDTVAPPTAVTTDADDPDGCRYTDPRPRPRMGDSEYWQPHDSTAMTRGVEYRCTLRPGEPEVRLMVRGEWGIPMVVDVYLPPASARRLQRLEVDNDERAHEGSELVEGEDLNGDGWTDLLVRTYSGNGGVLHDVFMYAPAQRAFVRDSMMSRQGDVRRVAGRPCVDTGHKMGLGHWYSRAYCWEDGRWMPTSERDQQWAGEHYIRTLREPRGDSMQVVRVDTLDDPNEGLYP